MAADAGRQPDFSVFRNSELGGATCSVAAHHRISCGGNLAWAFELTPEGIKRAENVDLNKSITRKPGRKLDFLIIAVLLLVIAILFFQRLHPNVSPAISSSLEKSIAVLPFENLSGEPGNAYFSDGIQEEILTRLAKIADLKVISRTSTQRFKSSPDNLREVAKQLGVANILEGSVQKAADQVRVNVQLVNATSDAHLWAETYDRKLTDIFAVESDIAKTIAETLRAKLTGAEQSAIAARPTENKEAHDLYLKGRYFVEKRTSENLKRAIDYFNQAIEKDPNYALAYAGLADSYALSPDYLNESAAKVLPKARAAAEKAISIDSSLAEAHVALGHVLQTADFNLKEAKQEFERAIELNQNYAAAHYFLGFNVLAPLGQFDQAIAEVKRAVELDPFSVIMNANVGLCYLLARRYPEAIAQLRRAVELDPNFSYTRVILAGALSLSGDFAGATKECEKAYEIENAYGVGGPPFALMFLARAYAVQGNREKALQLLGQAQEIEKRKGGVYAYGYALIYLALGDKNQAIDWLERSYQARETAIGSIKVTPFLDPLRGDPRFEALAEEVISRNGK
jgi:TolB-like protein/Tfp pilus assembly protein PilF